MEIVIVPFGLAGLLVLVSLAALGFGVETRDGFAEHAGAPVRGTR